jgi:hypothetical protein
MTKARQAKDFPPQIARGKFHLNVCITGAVLVSCADFLVIRYARFHC